MGREAVVICSVLEPNAERTRRAVQQAPRACDLVEVRADHLSASGIVEIVRGAGRPLLVTIRRQADGGGFTGSEDERSASLRASLEAGASLVDVEWGGALQALAEGPLAPQVVLSHHGAPCRLEELLALYRSMSSTRAARLKIVPAAEHVGDCLAVRALLAQAQDGSGRLASFATGRAGALSRLLAPSWGSWATYGAARAGAESAPGQFTACDMLETHDVLHIRPQTQLVALIGSHVFGSPSPAMHRTAYACRQQDWRCLPVELDSLEDVLPLLGLGIVALAVTMPFKEHAAARCRRLDELARACGAVNTVLLEPDGWRGHNTDGPAVLACVRRFLEPTGRRVAVLGAGGMARAAAFALHHAGSKVTLFNRTHERAVQAARALAVEARPLAELEDEPWDLLIQATPLGSRGELAVPSAWLTGALVLDAAYGPAPTPLVLEAERRGKHVIDGLELLAAQAALQIELIMGFQPEGAALEAAARRWLSSPQRPER